MNAWRAQVIRYGSFVLLLAILSLVFGWWAGRQPVAITVDLYPIPENQPQIEVVPDAGDNRLLHYHAIAHASLPGGRLRVSVHAQAFEEGKAFVMLEYRIADATEPIRITRFHPGDGDQRELVIDRVLPADVAPDSVALYLGIHRGRTPMGIVTASVHIYNPPWPAFTTTTPAVDEALQLDQWRAAPEHLRVLTETTRAQRGGNEIQLEWDGGQVALNSIESAADVPRYYEFEIRNLPFRQTPAGANEPAATHTHVQFERENFAAELRALASSDELSEWIFPEWGEGRVAASRTPYASIQFGRWDIIPARVEFLRRPDAGLSHFRSGHAAGMLDLFRESGEETEYVEVSATRTARRFEGVVPRRALKNLRLVATDGTPAALRFSVKTWPTRTWHRGDAWSSDVEGSVVSHWSPEIQSDGIRAPRVPAWERGGIATSAAVFSLMAAALMLGIIAWQLFRFIPPVLRDLMRIPGDAVAFARGMFHGLATASVAIPRVAILLAVGFAILAPFPVIQSIRNSAVDVGLDLSVRPEIIPVLRSDGFEIAMTPIPEEFAPSVTRAEVTTVESTSPAHEVWVRATPPEALLEHATTQPPRFWSVGDDWVWSLGGAPSQLSIETLGAPVTLEFRTQSLSRKVDLTGPRFESRFDLFSDIEGNLRVSLPDQPWARFHAQVPRRYLGNLRVELPGAQVKRLYIATFIPQVFFTEQTYPAHLWGSVHRDWAPKIQDGAITIPPVGIVERGGLVTYAVLGILIFLTIWLLAVATFATRDMIANLSRNPYQPSGGLRPFPFKLSGACFVAFAAIMSVYFALYYPGITNGDSRVQWEEAQSMQLRDNHPVLHTLLIKALRDVWNTWASVSVFQVVSLSAILALAFGFLVRWRVPWPAVAIAFALALLSPRIGVMSVSMWKDVPFAVLVFALTLLLALFFAEERVRTRWPFWIAFGIVLGLIPLIRHNGLVVLIVMTPFALWGFLPYWKGTAISLAIAWAIFLAMKLLVYPPLLADDYVGEATPDFWAKWMTLNDSRRLLAYDPPLAAEEYEFLKQVKILNPEDNALMYATDRFAANDPVRDYNFKTEVTATGRLNEASDLVQRLRSRYPLLTFSRVWLEERLSDAGFLFWRTDEIRWGFYVPTVRGYDIAGRADDRLHERLMLLQERYKIIYSQPVLSFYVVILACLLLWRRTRDARCVIIFFPVLFNSLAIVAVGASTSDRYYFPLELSAGFLACLAISNRIVPQAAKSP